MWSWGKDRRFLRKHRRRLRFNLRPWRLRQWDQLDLRGDSVVDLGQWDQRHHGIRSIDLLHDFKSLRSLGRVGAFTVSGADVASQVVSFALVFALILPRWQPRGHRVVDLGSLSWWRSPGRVGAFTVSGADVAPPQLGWVARRAAVKLPR